MGVITREMALKIVDEFREEIISIESDGMMNNKSLVLAVDMYGCPNRCRHCWLGHMPNRKMENDVDQWIVNYFNPYFDRISFYSWLREPDFCDEYRERWLKDNQLSVHAVPERYELASFWRIVRDSEYVKFLKEVEVKVVQLTFFGLENMTDKYVGRVGAFQELLQATEMLLNNGIAPRWQAFIYEENRDEIVALLQLSEELRLKERCQEFDAEFKFFIHSGGCDEENRKQYDIWIEKDHIPEILRPYYLNFNSLLTERECCEQLKDAVTYRVRHNEEDIVLLISNTYDVYFNFTHMSKEWRIGNLKTDEPEELVRKIVEEDTYALNLARKVTLGELVARYGDKNSNKAFQMSDYKDYLLNRYLEECGLQGA